MSNRYKKETSNEGQVIACAIYNAESCNGHKQEPKLETRRFLIQDGRRVWLSVPPMAWMREENRDLAAGDQAACNITAESEASCSE